MMEIIFDPAADQGQQPFFIIGENDRRGFVHHLRTHQKGTLEFFSTIPC
ncbi:hypothetical protein [Paenibacillus validus]